MEERPRIFTKCTPAPLVSNRRGPANKREPFYDFTNTIIEYYLFFTNNYFMVVAKELLMRTEKNSEGNNFMSPI